MDDLKTEIEENNKAWKQPGRPPRAVADKVKKETAQKKALRVQKSNKGNIIVNPEARMEKFLEAYLKNNGNATQAALDTGTYATIGSAADAGSKMLKRAKQLGLVRTMMEKKGMSHGKLLDVAIEKMLESKTPEWWDRLMKMADYEDFMAKKEAKSTGTVVNIIGAQRRQQEEFGFVEEGEIVETEEA